MTYNVFSGTLNPTQSINHSMARSSMDIGDGASLELVDMFRYLGHMLSLDGNDDAAVEARV